jgi:hypothetical protein
MDTITDDKVTQDPGASSQNNAPLSEGAVPASRQAEILQAIIRETKVAELPPLFRFLTPPSTVRRLAGSPDELVQALSERFPIEALCESDVIIREEGGTFRLSRVFGDGSSESLFIVPANAKTPGEICSNRGKVLGKSELSQSAVAENADSNDTTERRLLLVGSERDYQVLTALGLCAVLISALARLRGNIFRRIFRPNTNYKYKLIIVGWQLAALKPEPSRQTLRAVRHLWSVEHAYGFNVASRFAVLRASADITNRIRDASFCADEHVVRELLNDAATARCSSALDFYQQLDDLRDVDLATARSQLIRALAESEQPYLAAVTRAANRYRRALEHVCVEPHFAAAAQSDPFDGTVHVLGAWITQHILETDPLLRAADDYLQGHAVSVDWTRDPAALAEIIGVTNTLIRLKKSLKKSA